MNDTTTVGIEVRADGTQEAARDLAVVEASIRKVGKGLGEAAQYIGSAKLEKPIAGLDELAAKCNVSSRHMQNLARMMREVERERAFRQLAQDANLSTLQLARLRAEMGDMRGALATLGNKFSSAKVAILAWAAAIAFVGKACFDAALEMDRLQKSYRTVMGSDIGATTQLDYIYGLTQKLGLQFQSTAESAKGFFAASVGTSLENDMNDIFKGVTSAGTALSMTQEQMSGVFLAFSQIASKGKLSMEEVNQIAERLPGTFELVSKAMGVNRQEMFKMIEQGKVMSDDLLPKLGVALQEKFGDKAVEAANSAQGAVNRLSTEWEFFKSSASQTESIVQGINFVTDALKEAKNVLNKNNIVKEMSSKGYKTGQSFTQSYWNGPYTDQEIEAVQKYGEAVINANRQIDLVLAARLQKQREYEAEHQTNVKRALKIEQDGMTAWKDATKDLPTFKLIAIDKAEKEALKKLDEWHTRGTLSEKEYQEKKIQIETGYAEKRKSITDKGAKSAEAEANRAAKALAAYDEEIAKLTQSSRELEQVKIEEKLAKIAKDAKLPAAEMEKLRKAMEHEADFKWMQDILSYADPAAAAVAKVDKEYEAFLRNVGYLKKTDPAKYTQLMTKAETEHEKALRKAERASKEQNEHLQEKLSFYKELEEMSGAFGLSLEVQNRLLDEQMEIFRDADIPENLIQTWRQYKDLMNSHDWADGAQRAFLQYRADATDAAKGAEEAFSSLYSGMDSGWKSAWEQMIETGKVSLSSFRSVFASFLADLMHMAITRPITVQIAGVVSGMLGTGGVAYAAGGSGGGAGGLLGNIPLSNLSSFLPDSFTSGLSGIMGATLPGTVSALTTPGAYTAGEILLMQGGGTTAGTVGGQAALMSGGLSLGSALMYGGLGSLGYSVLGGALGLPQSKYSGLTAGLGGALGAWGGSALGSSAGIAAGSALGSVVPVVGTVLGAIGGGLLGSLFGGGRRTHASVYGKMEDVGFSRDQQTYIDAFMGGAWYDRAGKKEAEPFAQGIAQVASQTAGSLLDIAGALPEQIRQSALFGLETSTWSAGRGVSDASWNFQWWEEGMAEERLEEAAQDMRNQMTAVAQQVFADAGISQFFSSFDVTTDEGLQKASTGLSAISAVKSATDAIKSPLSEMEQQAQSAKAQLDAWTQGMKDSGVNAQYAAGLINEYRNAFINDYIKTLDESLHPLSAYAQAVKAANEAVDQRKKALEIIGATEGQLAQVEAMRAEVVKQATEEMLRSFDQSVAQRWAAVNGNSDAVGRAISQANELRETIRQFGEGSAQVAELLKLHAAETAKAAQDAAKSEYDSLRAQMDALEQQRVQLQQQAIQEQINAINEQLSAAKTLKSTWEGLDKSLGQSRYNLFAGSANLDAENRLGVTQAEFRRLSGLALGGDSDAAGQLAGVGTSLLDLVKQTAGTEEEYLDAFWAVNAQLKSAQDAAGAQVSAADKQLEALQGQLDVQNAALVELQGQSATLEEIEKQIAELRPLLDAAGDKAGVKAFARGGLAMPGWSLVGEEGPELVNFSQPGRVYTAADTAALFRSATPRAADTDSGSDAEVKALRREVYQLRRDMLISMSEIARFSRRTSDMVEAWDAEGMPGVRA